MPKVLIVDDDEGTRISVSGLLRLEGLDAATADTGSGGIALAVAEPADLILVDLYLSDMSGLDVVRALKTHGIQAPIVIITVFPDLDTSLKAAAVGAAGYVDGFISVEELLEIVLQALREPSMARHPGPAATKADQQARQPPSPILATGRLPLDQRIRRVIRLIDGEGGEAWSISALATHVRLSESRLRHLFAATLGLPLSRYVRQRRLLKAARLLINTSQSFRAISNRLHLSQDPRAVRQAFRDRFGMSPRTYRNRFWRPSGGGHTS